LGEIFIERLHDIESVSREVDHMRQLLQEKENEMSEIVIAQRERRELAAVESTKEIDSLRGMNEILVKENQALKIELEVSMPLIDESSPSA
jgi:hypothetical protein